MIVHEPQNRLPRLLAGASRELREEFLLLVQQLRNSMPVAEIEALLTRGRVDDVMRLLRPQMARFTNTWIAAYARAGDSTSTFLRRNQIAAGFSQINERSVRYLREQATRMSREFINQQVEATRQALMEGVRELRSAREVARLVRDTIGLNSRQATALLTYRRGLEEQADMTQRAEDQLVEQYRRRSLVQRAFVIGETESRQAVYEGSDEGYQQAIEDGVLPADAIQRTWKTRGDNHVRDSHTPMNGQTQPWGEPFVSGDGNRLARPGDSNAPPSDRIGCRCDVNTAIDTEVASFV